MSQEITIYAATATGDTFEAIQVPTDIQLSLMEVLKGSGYDIEAVCGGMALCATCHCHILENMDKLDEPSDDEWDMLDTLPVVEDNSRLSCQIPISEAIDGLKLRVIGDTEA